MAKLQSSAEIVTIIERHVDDAHRRMLRSVTDTMRFKTKSEKAQEQRALKVLVAVLVEIYASGSTAERLLKESYDRIEGDDIAAEDTRLRRRLQGIPEVAPQSLIQAHTDD
jgi:hypothetical protein